MSGTEYGVEWRTRTGEPYTIGGYELAGARLIAARMNGTDKGNSHRARVMRRPVGEWTPIDETETK